MDSYMRTNLKVTHIGYNKHIPESYSKFRALRAIGLYRNYTQLNVDKGKRNTNLLMSWRRKYGQQFLIDIFALSEAYIHHYPTTNMAALRRDIVWILTQVPEYRLKYEQV